jgi:hypothetical protein
VKRIVTALLPSAALILFAIGGATSARAETTIISATVDNNYPTNLTFKLTARADVDITDVTLQYQLTGRNSSGIGKPNSFSAGRAVSSEVIVKTDPDTDWIPVGNEFVWHFELTLADGSVFKGPNQTFLFLPGGLTWETATSPLLTVYYHGNLAQSAGRFVAAADAVFKKSATDLLKTDLSRKPVKVVLFTDAKELAVSQPSKGTTVGNSGIVTCGYRPGSANDIISVASSCGGSSSLDTFKHEFAHIINQAAGESPLVKLPFWLDEGLAVYAQDSPAEFLAAFQATVARTRQVIPFDRMNLIPSDPNQIIAAYGQGYVMTRYLIDTYGADKLASLMTLTKKQTRFDVALKQTYGFDIAEFEKEFVAKVITGPQIAPTTRPQQQQPTTTAPTQRAQPQSQPTPATTTVAIPGQIAQKNRTDKLTIGLVGLAGLFALMAIFFYLVSMMFAQNRQKIAIAVTAVEPEVPVEPDPERWRPPSQ